MGWGSITKAIKKPLIGAGIGSLVGGLPGALVGGVAGIISQQKSDQSQYKKNIATQTQLQQEQLAQLAQDKAIASESVRLQEEEARKRTLFAGTALGETSERKKLLGL